MNNYKKEKTSLLSLFMIMIIILSIMDIALTSILITFDGIKEINPLLSFIISNWGVEYFIIVKSLVILFFESVFYFCLRRKIIFNAKKVQAGLFFYSIAFVLFIYTIVVIYQVTIFFLITMVR